MPEQRDNRGAYTWRDLLRGIVYEPRERQRVAAALHMNQLTLTRWINSQTQPRYKSLRLLLNALPAYRAELFTLITAEFPDFVDENIPENDEELLEISSDFYDHMFQMYAELPPRRRYWSMSEAILKDAIEQIDPHLVGMEITLALCGRDPDSQLVTYLRENIGVGTPPWHTSVATRYLFLGIESFAGFVVASERERVFQNVANEEVWFPAHQVPEEASAAAYPITKLNRIAGCLIVSSTRRDYFTPALLHLIHDYATLLVLAFEDEDFYPSAAVQLGVMPSYEVQRTYIAQFQSRVDELMRHTFRDKQPLTREHAEQIIWQRIAGELLQLAREHPGV